MAAREAQLYPGRYVRPKEKGGESAGRARNGECGRERTWVTSITRVDVADVLFIEVILLDMQIS